MKKSILLATAALFAVTGVQASPLRSAVIAHYESNSRVRSAVYRDACKGGDMMKEERTARAHLGERDAQRYDRVSRALGKAYTDPAIQPTDAVLERIHADFCKAVAP